MERRTSSGTYEELPALMPAGKLGRDRPPSKPERSVSAYGSFFF